MHCVVSVQCTHRHKGHLRGVGSPSTTWVLGNFFLFLKSWFYGAGEMALAALPETQVLFPGPHVVVHRHLTPVPGDLDALFWPLQAPSTHAMRIHTCRPTHIKKNLIIFLKILCVLSLEEDIRYPGSEVIGGWKPSVGSRSWTWALHKNSKYS